MKVRIALDLSYGRNNKTLPTGRELRRFAKSLGYSSPQTLVRDYRKYTSKVYKITEPLYKQLAPTEAIQEERVRGIRSKVTRGKPPSPSELHFLRDMRPDLLKELHYD